MRLSDSLKVKKKKIELGRHEKKRLETLTQKSRAGFCCHCHCCSSRCIRAVSRKPKLNVLSFTEKVRSSIVKSFQREVVNI